MLRARGIRVDTKNRTVGVNYKGIERFGINLFSNLIQTLTPAIT